MASLHANRLAGLTLILLLKSSIADAALSGRVALSVSENLPTFWSYSGCFPDSPSSRILPDASYVDEVAMTEEACITLCAAGDYQFAGVEFGQECCEYTLC